MCSYKGLGWIRTAVILTKLQLGLGLLSIPCKFSAQSTRISSQKLI